MAKDNDIEMDIVDAIIDRPYGFTLGSNEPKRFYLYPITLGKSLYLSPIVQKLGINTNNPNPYKEALLAAKKSPIAASKIISIHTLKTKEELFDTDTLTRRINEIHSRATEEDLASLLVLCLTKDSKLEDFKKITGITKEADRRQRASNAKKSNNTFVFGGKSLYGSLIDVACERYGWSFDYVVWEISLINLNMLIADQVTSIFLTDEERKSVGLSNDRTTINADDKNNVDMIRRILEES